MRDEAAAGPVGTQVRVGLGLTLGVLSAIGPLAIDLYLPALPTLAQDLAAEPGQAQRTISVFLLALAAAQIPIGLASDRFGRKPLLYAGLMLFLLASLGCAFAQSISGLLVLRVAQGLGICAGTIISRAIIRDLASGHQAARLMALSFLVIGVSPVLAPLIGSVLLTVMSWRGLFVILAASGLAALALAHWGLPESLPPHQRVPRRTPVLPSFRRLLSNSRFVAAAVMAGLAMTVPYSYFTAAPFVFSGVYHLPASQYSVLLGMNAACSIATTQMAPSLMRRWGARDLMQRVGLAGLAVAVGALVLVSVGGLNLVLFQVASVLMFAVVGLLLTPAAITALDASNTGAGIAASTLGTIQLAVTSSASGLISIAPAFSVVPLLGIVAVSFAAGGLLVRTAAPVPHRSE